MSGAPESSIWYAKCCENQLFTYVGILLISLSFLHGFRWLGANFDDFWSLGYRLKTRWILRSTLGRAPRSWQCARSVVTWLLAGPHSNSQTVGVVLQLAKYSIKHAGMKGYEKTRMQITKIRKIKAVTCSHYNRGSRIQDGAGSLAAGHPRGRRILVVRMIRQG